MPDVRWVQRALVALLVLAFAVPAAAKPPKRAKRQPSQIEAGRFTVMTDRRPDRLAEITRRLWAVDRVLRSGLDVPPERLGEPVTLAYLHRTRRMERRLPFRGDRPNHQHLLPTDTRLWLLVREDDGLEDLRPAIMQMAEVELSRGPGNLPQWLRSGLYELLARANIEGSTLVLEPGFFSAIQATGVRRAPLEEVQLPGWSRYQDPRRWYTASLVVAYLFETDRATLAAALADPDHFDLPSEVDLETFEAWVDRAVQDDGDEPTVLELGLDVPKMEPVAISEEQLLDRIYELTATHKRGPRAFGLGTTKAPDTVRAELELRDGVPSEACRTLLATSYDDPALLEGLCLWPVAPGAAEERWRVGFRGQPGAHRTAIEAAALVIGDPARDAEAAALVDAALAVAPADADARLLRAVLDARAGECTVYSAVDPAQLAPIWQPIRHVEGPMARQRDAFVREVMECGR